MAELKERAFDCDKENGGGEVDADLDADKRGRGGKFDVVIRAELFDPVNNQFLNQVSAIGDAGDERGAGNCNSTEREPRTDRANK